MPDNHVPMKRVVVTIAIMAFAALGLTSARAQTNEPVRLPETTVLGTNEMRDSMLIGDNQQPIWTARRPFATTRVYVHPPWQVETEIGLRTTWPRKGAPEHQLTEEIELGLPYRFQVDFENATDITGDHWEHGFNAFELRYALADWGRIPLNPTIGAEWKLANNESDAFELKLQLGEEFSEHIHWGFNFNWEQQVHDDLEREFAASQAITYTLIDTKLSAGVEMLFKSESDKDTRDHPEDQFLIGPSFQWRPCKRVHMDVAPLFGVTGHAPLVQLFVFFGFDFGKGSREDDAVSPASMRAR